MVEEEEETDCDDDGGGDGDDDDDDDASLPRTRGQTDFVREFFQVVDQRLTYERGEQKLIGAFVQAVHACVRSCVRACVPTAFVFFVLRCVDGCGSSPTKPKPTRLRRRRRRRRACHVYHVP